MILLLMVHLTATWLVEVSTGSAFAEPGDGGGWNRERKDVSCL
jgi:hypothetical protein